MRPTQNYRLAVNHPVFIGGVAPDGTDRLTQCDLSPDLPDYITDEGISVWIERPAKGTKGQQKTRFVDADGNQVGRIHTNLVPAIVYAAHSGWRSPGSPDWFNDAVIEEVRAGGAPLDRHGDELYGSEIRS